MYNRRKFLSQTAMFGGVALLPWQKNLLSALLSDAGEMRTLRNNVGIYTERGGTIGWHITKDAVIVVDTQFKQESLNFLNKVRETTDRKIDLLINTHHHGDHTGGNIAFKDIVDTHVAHRNSKLNQEKSAKARNTEDQQLYPTTLYDQEWTKKVGDEIVTMRHFGAAHTNGDSVTHFENANIVHLGDLQFNRRFPYIDKGAGASIKGWIGVLDKVRKQFDKDTLFVCGHSGNGYDVTGNLEDIKAMRNYLKKLLKFGKKLKKAGTSQEDALKGLEFIPGAPEWKGRGIERNISALYLEMEGK